MISKISFFKMVKSECRRRVWILAILFVLFAGALPVTGLMQLQTSDTSDTSVYAEYSLETQETDGTSDFTAGMKEQQRIEEMQDSFDGMVGKEMQQSWESHWQERFSPESVDFPICIPGKKWTFIIAFLCDGNDCF